MAGNLKIYHNPRCSKSREALARMRERGLEPQIVEYLKDVPAKSVLAQLAKDSGLGVRGLMRTGEKVYKELGLGDTGLSDTQLLDAMVVHPALINRPIVVSDKGVRLGRPVEAIDAIL